VRRAVLFVLVPLALLCAAPAFAATGDLSFKDCIARFATGPCTAVPNEVLEGGRDVAVSPDGKYVYVADGVDSVIGFTRSGADGSVDFAGCVDTGGNPSCTHLGANTLLAPRALAFSPDGSSLYVAAETSDAIVRLTVGSGGALGFASCVEDDDLFNSGCSQTASSLDGPTRVAVSPDGASVYAVDNEWALNHFSAGLALQGCYREVPVTGCATQAEPLEGARGLGVSPDGKYVYVTSVGRDAIVWFSRGVGGILAAAGCIDDGDDATAFSDACTEVPTVDFNFLEHITFSPNGTSAYVTDETGLGVVYHFSRSELTGALTLQDCLADDLNVDAPGCTELDETTGTGLSSVTDAVVSPDAADLYTVAFQDSALSTFGLASPGGAMTFIRCLRANEFQGCTGFGSSVLDSPQGVAISPDGHDLYVSNNGTPALLHFEREASGTRTGGEEPGGEEPGPGPGPGSGGGAGTGSGAGSTPTQSPPPNSPPLPEPPQVNCNGLKATIVGTGRAETIRGTGKRDVIAAGAGDDKVKALGGKDVVCGEGGRDDLDGGADGDTLLGGPGKDLLRGAGGPDRLLGGPGKDGLLGGPGRDSVKQ
jgi:DNA-binding beta-propeller fold protein YncE